MTITGGTSAQGAIQTAAGIWNQAFDELGVNLIPSLSFTSSGGAVTVIGGEMSTNGSWCGGVTEPPTTVVMTLAQPNTQCQATSLGAGPYGTVIVQEFGHVLGFTDAVETFAVAGVSDHCAGALRGGTELNASPCMHEVEYLLESYDIANNALLPNDITGFWSKHIATGLAGPSATLDLDVGDVFEINVSGLLFKRGAMSFASLTTEQIAWSSDSTQIVDVIGPGEIRALVGGTTTLRGRVVSGLPSAYQIGSLFAAKGHEVPVTVTAPPPPPPGQGFAATDIVISGTTAPLTSPGNYSLIASATNPPPGLISFEWQVTYSNDPMNTITSPFQPNPYILSVPPGSYSISVTATPMAGGIIGFHYTEQITVCTGEFLMAGDGPTPNRVQGC